MNDAIYLFIGASFAGLVGVFTSLINRWLEKRKTKKDLLNVLLAEFKTNMNLLEDFKKEVTNIPGLKWEDIHSVFLGFREDGWAVFRNRGGFQYIDDLLYNDIEKYYESQYKIHKRLETLTGSIFGRFPQETKLSDLSKEIKEIQKNNKNLQKKIMTQLNEKKLKRFLNWKK